MKLLSRRRAQLPIWLKWMILTAAVFSALFVSLFVYLTVDAMITIINERPINPAAGLVDHSQTDPFADEPALQPITTAGGDGSEAVDAGETDNGADPIILPPALPLPKLSSDERVTILVMGVDSRPNDESFKLTDTMILFSYNPKTESASMLSIPRDLYIDIPGFGRNRINTAFTLGSRNGGDEAGAALAMETIQHNLSIEVDHYVLVDFQTAINVIDAIGGLTIDVPKTIDDPYYPDMNFGYDPLYIEAGTTAMDGELALKYMRTRHTDNDFFRATRQQQVIMAFRDKVLGTTAGIANAPAILKEMRSGIFTSLTTNDILGLANAGRGLSAESIQSAVMDYDYVYSHQTEGGASVLIMRTEQVGELVAQLFDQ